MLLEQQLYSVWFFTATTGDLYLTSIRHSSTDSEAKDARTRLRLWKWNQHRWEMWEKHFQLIKTWSAATCFLYGGTGWVPPEKVTWRTYAKKQKSGNKLFLMETLLESWAGQFLVKLDSPAHCLEVSIPGHPPPNAILMPHSYWQPKHPFSPQGHSSKSLWEPL